MSIVQYEQSRRRIPFLVSVSKLSRTKTQNLKPYFCHWQALNKFETLLSMKKVNCLAKFIYFADQKKKQKKKKKKKKRNA